MQIGGGWFGGYRSGRSRWFWLLGLLLTVGLALSSCQGLSLRTQAARMPQLVVTAPSDPSTFNYALNDSLYSVFSYLYEGLLETDGRTGQLQPGQAESWTVSPDRKKIIFTLREGLKWSDGEPLTAADVVFSFEQIYLNPAVPTGTRDTLRVGEGETYPSVRQLSDRQVEFTTPEPFAPFLRFSSGLPILPKHRLESTLKDKDSDGNIKFLTTWGTDTKPKDIIGNGPFTMVEYSPSQRVIFQRNPHYWKRDPQGQPLPYIDRIVYQIIESDTNQLIRFRSGELDSFDVTPEAFSLLKREEKKIGFTIYNGGPEAGTRNLSFNLNKGRDSNAKPFVDPIKSRWFNNVKFRQAIAYAINRQRVRDTIYRGLGEIQNSPLWSAMPYYLSPEAGLKVYEYQPEKSRQLLQEAGFTYDANGVLQDDQGNPVQFELLVKSEEKARVDMASQIAQDLRAIGMQPNLQVISFNTVLQKLQQRNWEAYVGGFGGGGLEPNSSSNIWRSNGSLHQFNQGPLPGDKPIQGWEVSEWEKRIDRLLAAGARELDEQKRKQIYGEFQQVVQEQLPLIHLVNSLTLQAISDRVSNFEFTQIGGAFWNLPEVKVE